MRVNTASAWWLAVRFEEYILQLVYKENSYFFSNMLEERVNIPTHTMLRIEVAEYITDYANVNLVANNLYCDHDFIL